MEEKSMEKSAIYGADRTGEGASEMPNDTIAAALKEAGLTREDCTEQVITIEAGTDSILDMAVQEDLHGTVFVIVPQEADMSEIGEQDLNGIEEQEIHTSNHVDEGHFTCSNCSNVFTDRKKFHEHKCLNNVILEDFLCKDCGKVCTDENSLKIHAKIHLKVKTMKKQFTCEKCGKLFSQKWSCENHSCYTKKFMCEHCGKGYGRKGDLKRHIACVHTMAKPFQCKSCDKKFATKWHLTQHEQGHTGGKCFQCQECGKRYTQKSHLDRHKFVHSADAVKCNKCSRRFLNNSELLFHKCKSKQKPTRFACELCEKTFSRKNDMKRHLFLHTGTKPFPCSYCKKSFVTRWHLKHHERSHTGERPYHCHCGKQFTQKSHLDNHKVSHASQVFKCKHCKRKFSEQESLSRHEKIHFKDKEQETRVDVIDSGLDSALEYLLEFAKESSKATDIISDIDTNNDSQPNTTQTLSSDDDRNNSCIDSGEVPSRSGKATDIISHIDANNDSQPNTTQPLSSDDDRNNSCTDSEKVPSRHDDDVGSKDDEATHNSLVESGNNNANEPADDEDKRNICKYCNRTYKYRARLLKHIVTHAAFHFDTDTKFLSHQESEYLDAGGKLKLFTCLKCNRTYSNEAKCNDHKLECKSQMPTNQIEKPVDVDDDTDKGLTKSVGENDSEDLVCKVCNKVFLSKVKHHQHMSYHRRRSFSNVFVKSGDPPVKMWDTKLLFVCSYCSKEFTYKTSFERHEHQHREKLGSTEKPKPAHLHICVQCGMDFRRITHLKRHMEVHKGKETSTEKQKLSVIKETRENQSEVQSVDLFSSELDATSPTTPLQEDRLIKSPSRTNNRPVRRRNTPIRYRSEFGDFQRDANKPEDNSLNEAVKCDRLQCEGTVADSPNKPYPSKEQITEECSGDKGDDAIPDSRSVPNVDIENEQENSIDCEDENNAHLPKLAKIELRNKKICRSKRDAFPLSRSVSNVDENSIDNQNENNDHMPVDKIELRYKKIRRSKRNAISDSRSVPNVDMENMEENSIDNEDENDAHIPVDKIELRNKKICQSKQGAISDSRSLPNVDMENVEENSIDNEDENNARIPVDKIELRNKKVRRSKRTASYRSLQNGSSRSNNDDETPHSSQVPLAELSQRGVLTCDASTQTGSKRLQRHKENKTVKQAKKKRQITFGCKTCKKEYISKRLLDRHLKYDALRPLTCSICCRRFSVQESLERHEAAHIGNYLLSCKVCGKGFNHQTPLTIHMQKHTGNKTHMCDVCGKMFVTKFNLKAHHYIHSGDSPNVCKFCGKNFGRKNDLTRHESNHEGSQPFSCSLCGRKFVNRWHLRYHEQSHANEKPYNCDICSRGFSKLKELKRHKTSVHGTDDGSGK